MVKGHGFGHGVGMSQYGAYGFAKHGKGYRFILAHYYRGTSVGKLAGRAIVRVLIAISGGDVGFSGATSACGKTLDAKRELRGPPSRGERPPAQLGRAAARRLRRQAAGHRERAGSRSRDDAYRGALEVVPTNSDPGSLNAINAVPIDQYVKGVIANESPSSWPLAALRAQAVAARSYALTSGVDGNGFDLYNDTRSQVYEGIASETAPHQQRHRGDQGRGGPLPGRDRPDVLLRLLGRPHGERPERLLRPARPLPRRGPRSLRRASARCTTGS